MRAKLALGAMQQGVDIQGLTNLTIPGQATQSLPGGFLATSSNIGHYNRTKFAVVPELGANVGIQVNNNIRAFVGYTFLYLSNVVRPGPQIDLAVNRTQLQGGTLSGDA